MKKILFVFLFTVVFLFSSCSQIEDTNGPDDYSIQTFTEEEMLSGVGNVTSFVSGKMIFMNNYTYTCKKYSGIETLERFKKVDSGSITILPEVTSGNFRVLILRDDALFCDCPINEEVTLRMPAGNYKIIIVGESANYKLKYTIK